MALTGSKQHRRMPELDFNLTSTPELREATVLRRAMRDLLALCTIPAAWVGREPDAIARGVVDVLVTALRVECGYLMLPADPVNIEAMQGVAPPEVLEALRRKCAAEMPRSPLVHDLCQAHRAAVVPIRVASRSGFVAAISSRMDFPTETESMLVSVAANQAAISLEAAQLRAEADLERRRLQELMEQAPAAMGLMYGPEHRWTYVNDYYVRVTGRASPADFIGKTLEESLPETETAVFRKLLDDVYRTGNPYVGREMKATLIRAGQTVEAYFDFVYQAIRNSAGEVRGILVHAVEVTDKVLARRAIAESEARLRAIIETTPECVKLVAADGTLLDMNSVGLSLVDADCLNDVVGKSIYDVIATEDRERFRDFNEKVCGGQQGTLEFDIIGLKGVRRHMQTHAAPLSHENGQKVQLAVTRDITEHKRAEEALRRSEEEFRALANTVPQLVWMANTDGWIFWYNQQWYQYTGTTPEQMEGWGWQSVHDPGTLPSVLSRWKHSIASGDPFEMTFPIRGSDGVFRPFLTRVVPIRDQQRKITRWFGTNTDISAEVSAREELRNNHERLQTALIASQRLAALVESSDDAIVSKDLNGIVTSWNSCAERTFGYTAKEMIGSPITNIIPSELQEDERRILATIVRGERIEHFETVRMKKGGERIDVSLTISPIKDQQGKVIGAAKIARDITQRKRTEKALQLTEKLASVGRLAATVAHEINNPLEAVTNLLFLARKDNAMAAKTRQHLELAEQELDRVAHVAKQTLGFYRDSSARDWVNISQIVGELLEVYEYRLRNRDVLVEKELDDSAKVFTSAGEFRQVFSNIFINAMDAVSLDRGRIRVRIRRAHEWTDSNRKGILLTVADNGSGIGPEHMSRIFDAFYTTKNEIGTGLGLWLSQTIVQKYDGQIRVRSRVKPGQSGSVFSIFWPEGPEAKPASTQSAL